MRTILTTLIIASALVLGACGDDDDGEGDSSGVGTGTSTGTSVSAEDQNDQVIEDAQQAPDAQAAITEEQVRETLDRELNLQNIGGAGPDDFRIPGGGLCYVKTGAEAADAAYQTKNILRSPDGQSLVFVQTFQGTPLADCLVAVNDALDW